MPAIRIEQFSGMVPRFSSRLIPNNNAEEARNARMLSGELRGLAQPEFVHEFTGPTILTAYRARKDDGTDVWMGFENLDVDVVRGPVIEDSFDRYYWTGEEAFVAYNSLLGIEANDPPFRLGTPRPSAAPALSAPSGGTPETRAYVFTFVNEFGEEGAPSDPTVATGNGAGTWNLTGLPTSAPDMTGRKPIQYKRIYRTATGEASANYYFVAQIPIIDTTYADTALTAAVVRNAILESDAFEVPQDDLQGLISHPNGFFVAFRGKELHFSTPYRPHAWDSTQVRAIEHEIVGLGIYNNMVAVMTTSQPYWAVGSDPRQMSLVKSPSVEPCRSKGGIAQTVSGVLYPSSNGIVLFNENGPQVVTYPLMTKDEWQTYISDDLRAAQFAMRYIAFKDNTNGFVFAPSDQLGTFFELDRFSGIDNVQTDVLTGDVWVIRENSVYRWEPASGAPLYYTWKSKVFDLPEPLNFAAVIVKAMPATQLVTDEVLAEALAYNTERIAAAALHTYGWAPLGGSRTVPLAGDPFDPVEPGVLAGIQQNRLSVGGSPLFSIVGLSGLTENAVLNVYAENKLRATLNVRPNEIQRLPDGFKAHTWQFELLGNLRVYSLAAATTARELKKA